jgi:hypothetical protein
MTWGKRLYFPSEGRHAEDFLPEKNPTALVRFRTRKLGYKRPACQPLDHRSHSHPRLVPRLRKEYSYTFTPPLSLRGLVLVELYLYLYLYLLHAVLGVPLLL